METFIAYLVGVIFGSVVTNVLYWRKRASGTLRIDHTNPEKDIYRIEIESIDDLSKKNKIELKVDHNAILSQD